MSTKLEVLRQYFGYASFRPGQEELIDAILAGRDALGIMPTGGGKSICYQVPAMLLPGVTIVISPLISLMQDQVMALRSAGIPAAYINSSLLPAQISKVYGNLLAGQYRIVYVAPERLESEDFRYLVSRLQVSLIAVDEAHCISQWGQDFRPSYLKIVSFLDSLAIWPPLAAFTATATQIVREDIVRILALRDPVKVLTGFDRPNLRFSVLTGKGRADQLLSLIRERRGRSGIVYCNSRNGVERVCEALNREGISATRYHAGLGEGERSRNQEDFLYDRKSVMVATNAFGMGIDKSNVSFVIHYNLPLSLEAYYQEAGRAGRDGEKADCILLFAQSDIRTARMLIEGGNENEALTPAQRELRLKQNYDRLDRMVGYCKTADCLRGYILDYFGQEHDAKCGNCGNCAANFHTEDVTVEAQQVLSCVARAKMHLGYSVGKVLISHVLLASRDHRIAELGLETIRTYGLMQDVSRARVQALIDRLEDEGYLLVTEHGGLELTPEATVILRGEKRFSMAFKEEPADTVSVRGRRRRKKSDSTEEGGLYDALRALRAEIAAEEQVPQYIVFSNATLADMAERQPRNRSELLEVSGVGEKKAAQYGERFLAAVRSWHSADEEMPEEPKPVLQPPPRVQARTADKKIAVLPESPFRVAEALTDDDRLREEIKKDRARGEELWRAYCERERKQSTADPERQGRDKLVQALKALRLSLAEEYNVSPFYTFTMTTVEELADKRPRNREELLRISGFGENKVEMFGKQVLAVIASFTPLQGSEEPLSPLHRALLDLRERIAKKEQIVPEQVLSDNVIAELAKKRPERFGEFHEITGLPLSEAARYGGPFLVEIAKYPKKVPGKS